MVTCQSRELGWEVTVELPTDFLSLGRGSIIGVAGVELVLADEVMGAVPGPDLLRPRSDVDVHVGSGIRFPSSFGCNHLFSVRDPYGIHNTWLSLSLLGLSSFKMATLETFRAASHVDL